MKRLILLFTLFIGCLNLLSAAPISIPIEAEEVCPCDCDKMNDLEVLRELYNNNGGENWNLAPTTFFQDLLFSQGNFAVPNAGNPWQVDSPGAQNRMGNWHGIQTNQFGCITDLILWSGIYNGGEGVGITGALPESLNQLCALERLMLPHNNITGSLPPNMDNLCNLNVLLLQNNELEGPLPPEIGNMTNLLQLSLHDNAFSGPLPDTYMHLPELLILHLRKNKLSGAIPNDIGNLDKLVLIDLSDNCFAGTVPASIVDLGRNSIVSGPEGGVLRLSLQNNKLDSLPDITAIKLVNSPSRTFDVSGNHFTFDDIIPNRQLFTKYDNQTLDLNLYYCLNIGDALTLRPGFDEIIDNNFYGFGTRNRYLWARGSDFTTVSNINQISFTDVSLNSAGNFSIEVTNPLAPDMVLSATNMVIDVLDPRITGTPTVCLGTSTTLGINTIYETYAWSNGATTDTLVVDLAGTYSLTVTNENGCSATTMVEVDEAPSPPIFVAKTNDLDCDNDEAQVYSITSGADVNYEWTDAAGTLLGTNTLTYVDIPGFYTLAITNEFGCSSTATIEVLSSGEIATPEITGNLSFCEGDSAQLNVVGNYSSYKWSTGDSTSIINVNNSGVYTVTVTSSTGCAAVNSVNVSVPTAPSFEVLGNRLFCPDDSTLLSVDTFFVNYDWSTGDTTRTTFITTAGTYSVTVTDNNNCTSSTTLSVEETPRFTAEIAGDTTICRGSSVSLIGNPFNNTYDWSTGENEAFLLAMAAGTYGLTVTDENGCTSTASKTIIEYSEPVLNILGDTLICKEGTIVIQVLQDYATYRWSTGANTRLITVDTAGIYSVTITDINGCQNELTHTVKTTTGPILPEETLQVFCAGSTSILQAPAGFRRYQWATGENTPSIEISAAMDYSVSITDDNGCTNSMVFKVVESENPAPEIIGDIQLCKGTLGSLTTEKDFQSYLWSTGDTTKTIFISTPGNYLLTVTDANACTGLHAIEVQESPDINLTIIGNTAICSGASTTLRADNQYLSYIWNTGSTSSSIPVTETGTYSLTVSDNSGCTGEHSVLVLENDILFPQITGNTFICEGGTTEISAEADYVNYKWSTGATTKFINIDAVGTYSLTVTSDVGCTGTVETDITAAPILLPKITGSTSICADSSTVLGLDTLYSSYIWNNGETTKNIQATAGTYAVTITNQDACTGEASITIEEQITLIPNIAGDSAICANTLSVLNTAPTFASYAWSTSNSNSILSTSSSALIFEPDTYLLTVTDENGCQGINQFTIEEFEPVQLAPSSTDPFCKGDTVAIELSLLGFSAYQWSTGDTTASIKVETGGIYEVSVINEFGCEGSTTYEVTEFEPPIVNVNNAGDSLINLCIGESTILFGVIDNAFQYKWENEKGEFLGAMPVLEIDEPGAYSLVVEDNTTGCIAIETTNIYGLPNPVELNIEDSLYILDCENKAAILDASSSQNANFFYWQRPEAGAITFLTEGLDSATYSATTAGNYRVIARDVATNCRDSAMIVVVENIDTLFPKIEGILQVCENEFTQLQVKESYAQYEWQTGQTTRTIDNAIAGTYFVTVTDDRSCTGATSVNVLTKKVEDIKVDIASDIANICEGSEVKVNFNILDGGIGPYDITYTDGINTNTLTGIEENVGSIQVTPQTNSRYEILDIIDYGNVCYTANSIDTAFLEFNIQQGPQANAIQKGICGGQETDSATFDLTKFITEINGNSNLPVNWYTTEDRTTIIENLSDFRTEATTIYATVLGACESTPVPVTLEINNCATSLEMTHESGTVLDLSHLNGNTRAVYITNRWGDLVYASTDYEGFDNKFKGTNLPQGAYYIYIKNTEKGLPVPYKGVIYLLKGE